MLANNEHLQNRSDEERSSDPHTTTHTYMHTNIWLVFLPFSKLVSNTYFLTAYILENVLYIIKETTAVSRSEPYLLLRNFLQEPEHMHVILESCRVIRSVSRIWGFFSKSN
ncbi:hypothetical protein ABZP36_024197 [Zizania latifolia]